MRATVAGERGDANQGRDLLAVQAAEFGELGEQGAADDGTDPGTLRRRFSFARQTGLSQSSIEILIHVRHSRSSQRM